MQVYQVRGASLNRSSIQISFEDGTIAFTKDVMGRITGAFFAGDGEILLPPPNEAERQSMSLFTGMAILEERFATAYLRFNDDVANELAPDLRATTENKQEFVDRWGSAAKNMASVDAMRLLLTFSKMLPEAGRAASEAARAPNASDRFLHARLQGAKLGVFDVYFDSAAAEQILAGQSKGAENGETYYDVWTSFSPIQGVPRASQHAERQPQSEEVQESRVAVRHFTITTDVLPPKKIQARARVECEVAQGGARTLLFELSRSLEVESVTLDGRGVEFIHNPALEGTQISRRGNDTVAVVLPEAARSGQKFTLEFVYGGEVLAEAGTGLLYVGERGTWYPNRGLEMANFDLQFTFPAGWTLVATGHPDAALPGLAASTVDRQTSRWVSERPIPVAGFNLGKYKEVTAQAGSVKVETYATKGVERDFPTPPVEIVQAKPNPTGREPQVILPSRPSPAQTELAVAESAAHAIQYFAERFGPFPYSQLSLTQIPGRESQGWPGLIFLSSYVFLTAEQRQQLHYSPDHILVQESIPAHETAHQWWGDLVMWKSYRDQWFSEGLANYSALMMLQEKNPAGFREVMDAYRNGLIEKNKDGKAPREAGAVTLGTRLLSSKFPEGYQAISYGRATWLFHMLRTMMKDAAASPGAKNSAGPDGTDEPFLRALRQVRERYEGKPMSTREMLAVFAENLPPSLRYEGKTSLDWFLDGWVNGTSLPKLDLKAVKFVPKGAGVAVSGTILQKEAPQDLVTSVPVYAVTTAGRQPILLGRVFADGEESSFRLAAPAGTHKILLDPYGTILSSPK